MGKFNTIFSVFKALRFEFKLLVVIFHVNYYLINT